MAEDAATAALALRRFDIRRVRDGESEHVVDTVAVEEPLAMRLLYRFKDRPQSAELAVTMRTPGHDRELTAGYLLSEGIIFNGDDIASLNHIGSGERNEIAAELAPHVDVDAWRQRRQSFVGSSCGICGKQSREAIATRLPPLPQTGLCFTFEQLQTFPALLGGAQAGFSQTGGLHAAALINASGELMAVYEDIGRHNALDKLIGHSLLAGMTPLHAYAVFLSSRSSFELIQKAASAGIPFLATVGGPSSLAIEAAQDCGMTLVGFVRPARCNVYSGHWRLHS